MHPATVIFDLKSHISHLKSIVAYAPIKIGAPGYPLILHRPYSRAGTRFYPLRELRVYKNTRMKLNIRVLHIYYLAWRLPVSGPQGWSDKSLR